jgi:hypothetical protein
VVLNPAHGNKNPRFLISYPKKEVLNISRTGELTIDEVLGKWEECGVALLVR